MSLKQALSRFRAPGEGGAEQRAWEAIRTAYHERLPVVRRRTYRRPAGGLAVVIMLIGAVALSPAGATVGRLISRALGVQHATPALSALPAPGRLLVSGAAGTWTVGSDGSIRRVGPWTEASWSPHGLYLTVASSHELAAVNPHGARQWTLARPQVSDARWYSPTGYRVAYLSRHDLRVVAGDGTQDHLLAAPVALVAPAWRPGHPYQLAYLTAQGKLVVRDADSGRTLWSARPGVAAGDLTWSADGKRLLVLSAREVLVYTARGRLLVTRIAPRGVSLVGGALSPDGHTLALVDGGANGAVILENVADQHAPVRRVLSGSGLGAVAWSPDGHWLLITWPAANQWVFVRVVASPRISAVSRIAQQFSAGTRSTFPQLEGWCCGAGGAAG